MNNKKHFAIELDMPKYHIGSHVIVNGNIVDPVAEVINIKVTFEGSIFWDHDGGVSCYTPKNILIYTVKLSDGTPLEATEDQLSSITGV